VKRAKLRGVGKSKRGVFLRSPFEAPSRPFETSGSSTRHWWLHRCSTRHSAWAGRRGGATGVAFPLSHFPAALAGPMNVFVTGGVYRLDLRGGLVMPHR